ncbi:MAG: dihydroorotase [Crocinitomicaceae bacterium]|mgnify:FL=1|nr:dihydroorotase [Crocinitomicaceae bacterium]MBT6028979.1 dihydroorotase [Crocinitomicaceae bacterium]MBT6515732.1 dihydroorotase [Crocinitomicaceae bacterium]
MGKKLIQNATIINENDIFIGDILIEGSFIVEVCKGSIETKQDWELIDATGLHCIPGLIDDQVHFREPGLTHKADISSESKAALAGGITSFMEMPNTVPNTLTQELLEDKYKIAATNSYVNYSFFMGASNDNLDEVLKTNPKNVCGIKVFMGSSTGNMLVDNTAVLERLFSECKMLIATHCEDEAMIQANLSDYRDKYGEDVPISCHPEIRSAEACFKSSSMAVELAKKHNTRLHVLHISSQRELELFEQGPVRNKKITSEACVHHLWFTDDDYAEKGTAIKWNPAVKKESDRDAIMDAVKRDVIDVIATDHAPHTKEEKANTYFNAPSGGPLVQHALVAMLEHYHTGKMSLEKIVEKMCHAVADCFQIEQRGYIRNGYYADLVLVDLNESWQVNSDNILYKCGWSPFNEYSFRSQVKQVFINGHQAFSDGQFLNSSAGQRLTFDR